MSSNICPEHEKNETFLYSPVFVLIQAVGEQLFVRYLQRWGKDYLRRRLDWIVEENGMHEMPRHLQSSLCPCQYAEELILNKPRKDARACCPRCNDWLNVHGISLC